jgi:branched-chain amino acid transport system ATP-binding protein
MAIVLLSRQGFFDYKNCFSILLAEQNLALVLAVVDHIYVINKGMVVFQGTREELQRDEKVNREYLAL